VGERVAIVGAREHPRLEMVREYVQSLPAGTIVVSGGAPGADLTAEDEASERGLMVARYDEQAPLVLTNDPVRQLRLQRRDRLFFRNTLIAVHCERMVVFPDGSKGGCWDAAREAVRFRRPVEVRWCDGRIEPYPRYHGG
jgi:predicted Rossmann fold nucleotide-binding protein DprA/Smf involved in DNA uptake